MSTRNDGHWRAGASGWALAALLALGAAAPALGAGIAITQPASEETVHSNLGEVPVRVQVTDADPGSRVRLSVDGKAWPLDGGGEMVLRGLDRGTHVLRAELVAADGQVVATSEPVTIHLWRASRLHPHRRP